MFSLNSHHVCIDYISSSNESRRVDTIKPCQVFPIFHLHQNRASSFNPHYWPFCSFFRSTNHSAVTKKLYYHDYDYLAGLVMSLIGSSLTMLVTLILPCACFLRILRGKVTRFQSVLCITIISIGVVCAVFGTYSALAEIVKSLSG
ncbi:hypothetical protein Ahy_B09g098916 isoform A [Arachis hypogaea]|uniref:Amino acid transporter transmembrane domain-containing protein n=1 Tax=Arachis hypogaea TaxID=3818 RepID=A0A444XSM0_ARAHY|nr:hypothetical protein Ahy_B09g098916 isoform A [Arachis hypogaea]